MSLYEHFKGVRSILSDGGRYIFVTCHKYVGPSDISGVFNCDKPMGMHLKEYTYYELKELLTKVGFKDIRAALRIPTRLLIYLDKLKFNIRPRPSRTYLALLLAVEKLISLLPAHGFRQKLARPLSGMFIIAEK